jgi:asparagine synthase (glutamine-hydrolysing)
VYLGETHASDDSVAAQGPVALDERIYRPDDTTDARTGTRQVLRRIFETGDWPGLAAIRGPFAAAYWNERAGHLLLSVDQLGNKSLYFCRLPGRVAFASEYKAFFALPDFRPEIDPTAIQYYQAVRTAMPWRPSLANVSMVRSGSVVRVENGEAGSEQYWMPEVRETSRSAAEWSDLVAKQLTDAVGEQVSAHDRAGISLSAGIDSAVVAALARRFRSSADVAAYSIGFTDSDPEILGARQVADYLDIDHNTVIFDAGDIKRYLPELVWLIEDCTAREETLLHLKLFQYIAGKETLLLHGLGSDALYGGMPRHKVIAMAQRYPLFRMPLHELYQLTQTGTVPRSALGQALGWMVFKGTNYAPPRIAGTSGPTVVTVPGDLNQYLAGSSANMSGAHYIEPMAEQSDFDFRSPFAHVDSIDLAMSIPARFKVDLRRQKMVFRNAFADLLPERIMKRPKTIHRLKHDVLLSDALDEMVTETESLSHVRERRLVDTSYLDRLQGRSAGSAYATDHLYRIWTLINLELWLRQFVDGGGNYWAFKA